MEVILYSRECQSDDDSKFWTITEAGNCLMFSVAEVTKLRVNHALSAACHMILPSPTRLLASHSVCVAHRGLWFHTLFPNFLQTEQKNTEYFQTIHKPNA